jgi:membrane protease YdiL (CAAX protease family)
MAGSQAVMAYHVLFTVTFYTSARLYIPLSSETQSCFWLVGNNVKKKENTVIKEIFPEQISSHRNTWVWAVPILVFAIFILGQLSVILPADALGLVSRETIETYPTVLYLIIGTFTMVGLLFILWIRFFERRTLASVGLIFNRQAKTLYVRGFAIGLLMGSAVVCGILLLGGYGLEAGAGSKSRDLIPILILMVAFIVQSGVEEMVFRGWMMSRISARFGLWAGIIGNSILFTLMHVEFDGLDTTPVAMIVLFNLMTFLFSVFLSFLVIREKSIWGASAWHAAWNWIFITWFALPTTGIELGLSPLVRDLAPVEGAPEWLTGGMTGPEGSVLTLIVLTLGCLILLWRGLKPDSS